MSIKGHLVVALFCGRKPAYWHLPLIPILAEKGKNNLAYYETFVDLRKHRRNGKAYNSGGRSAKGDI